VLKVPPWGVVGATAPPWGVVCAKVPPWGVVCALYSDTVRLAGVTEDPRPVNSLQGGP